MSPVLTFHCEMLIDVRRFERPANYALQPRAAPARRRTRCKNRDETRRLATFMTD